jgi:hypothetical protein
VGGPQEPHHQGEEAQAGGGGEVGRIRKVRCLSFSSCSLFFMSVKPI